MSNKIPFNKQYVLFLDYLEHLFNKYQTKDLNVNNSDFFKVGFKRNNLGLLHPQEINFHEVLLQMEQDGLINYEKGGMTFGKVHLKDSFFTKLQEVNTKMPIPKEKKSETVVLNISGSNVTFGDNSPINITQITNSFNKLIEEVDKSDIPSKEKVKEELAELSKEAKKENWNIEKIKKTLHFLKTLPPWVYEKAIIILLGILFGGSSSVS